MGVLTEFAGLPCLISRKTFRRVSGLSEHSMTALIANGSIRRLLAYASHRKGMYYKADLARIAGLHV